MKIINGDCRDVLRRLPSGRIHCVVTSPPYFGLRDYGTGRWEGGDPTCKHIVGEIRTGLGMAKLGEQYRGGGHKAAESKPLMARALCPHCGARRIDRQIGMEESVNAYVTEMVGVFREIRRVLRDDGTAWLNLGDSYYGGGRGGGAENAKQRTNAGSLLPKKLVEPGAKPKDLMLVPARVALALQADGWWIRSDIIWSKNNPMPESIRDRPTSAHEHIFLLTKSLKYWYDSHAIRESSIMRPQRRLTPRSEHPKGDEGRGIHVRPEGGTQYPARNARNVWTLPTQPYRGAHFAVFPKAIPEKCISAGCPPGGIVLDPFAGAGTTGLVAHRLGRSALLIDLNPEYVEIMKNRIDVADVVALPP